MCSWLSRWLQEDSNLLLLLFTNFPQIKSIPVFSGSGPNAVGGILARTACLGDSKGAQCQFMKWLPFVRGSTPMPLSPCPRVPGLREKGFSPLFDEDALLCFQEAHSVSRVRCKWLCYYKFRESLLLALSLWDERRGVPVAESVTGNGDFSEASPLGHSWLPYGPQGALKSSASSKYCPGCLPFLDPSFFNWQIKH